MNKAAVIDDTKRRTARWLALCAALLSAFAALCWTSVSTKSATADEPLHALGAYMRLFHGDFRLNVEDPPLFGYWAMLPHSSNTLSVPMDDPQWQDMLGYMWRQWRWCGLTLYRTPGNDPDAFISRSRAMMLVLGVGLGAVLMAWSWRLAGPVAALGAGGLYAFDPNFLGHAALVKNDVPITLVMFASAMATWSVGRRISWWNVLLLALLCATAINVKFSGMLLGPIVALGLAVRAFLPRPWPILRTALRSVAGKLLAVALILVFCGATSIAFTWACYGFRYAPTPDPSVRLNVPLIIAAAVRGQQVADSLKRGEEPSPQELEAYARRPIIRAILWADERHLLPHAWLVGLLDTYATTRARDTYLFGQRSRVGKWYYFPVAMLVKTPTATLAAIALAMACWVAMRSGTQAANSAAAREGRQRLLDQWSFVCIATPLVLYGVSALRSDLNLGLRHVFPLYPFIFLLVGVALARGRQIWPRASLLLGAVLGAGLAVETLFAWPHYIPFFNAPTGGARGGFRILGDSNLDWGQDLLMLRRWQQQHPGTKLYVSYFGMADPIYYLDYTPLPGNASPGSPPQIPSAPGVAAVSATNLQGLYLGPLEHALYDELQQKQQPFEVLGGTIYLFHVFPGDAD